MAEPSGTPSEATGGAGLPSPAAGLGAKGKLMAVGFVLLVVLLEVLVALLVFPSADDTEAMAQAMLARHGSTSPAAAPLSGLEESDEQEKKEVDLGEFDVSSFQPLSNTTLRINVHLYGTVLPEDETELISLLEEKQQRMREQVLVTLRSAEITDLTDAGLGLIKRKILEKINHTFGKPLLQQIIFSEFSFFEQ